MTNSCSEQQHNYVKSEIMNNYHKLDYEDGQDYVERQRGDGVLQLEPDPAHL